MSEFFTNQNVIDLEDPDSIEKRNNRKLTADKIRQILSKVLNSPTQSAKRWVWELMQNAKDVPNKKFGRVSIRIVLNADTLIFEHNGDPFSLSNIYSLIQQVSSKDSTNADEEVTGKFGTGFISTHLLSEIIKVEGCVLHRGIHRSFETVLDRSGDTSEEMLPKIDAALDRIKLIENDSDFPRISQYDEKRTETNYDTKFTYYLTTEDKKLWAKNGIGDLINTLPVTLVNIEKVKRVEVVDNTDNTKKVYESLTEKDKEGVCKVQVTITDNNLNKELKHYITYQSALSKLTVEVNNFEELALIDQARATPQLYRDFPLIGSNKFYFPYLLNGFMFNPTEDRNGILLHSKESKEAVENRKIIIDAFGNAQNLTEWLINRNAKNRYLSVLSRLPDEKWEDFSKEWYIELQKLYRQFLLTQPLIENNSSSENDITILGEAKIPTFGVSKEDKLAFYNIVKDFIGNDKVPKESLVLNWIDSIGPKDELETWDYEIAYTLKDFLNGVQEVKTVDNLQEILGDIDAYTWLNDVYVFLITHKETEALDDYKIIPNHENKFIKLKELFIEDNESKIDDHFLDILQQLGANWRADLIHRKIILPNQNINKRGLNDVSKKILSFLSATEKNVYGNTENKFLNREDAPGILISIVQCVETTSTREDFRCQIFKRGKLVLKFESDLQIVINTKDFDFSYALRQFINFILGKIEELKDLNSLSTHIEKDLGSTVIWLNNFLALIEKREGCERLLDFPKVIPNRNGDFQLKKEMYSFGTEETPLDDELIGILHEIDNTKNWAEELIHDGFELNLAERKFEELGNTIDESLKELERDDMVNPGSIFNYKRQIFKLLDWSKRNKNLSETYLKHFVARSNDLWVKFSMTSELLELLKDEDSLSILKEISDAGLNKDDITELISLSGKLNEAGINGIEELLKHGNDLLEIEQHFQFMKGIGENIEAVFNEALKSENLEVNIDHQGWGSHDFKISKNGSDFKSLYIEIKSYKNRTNHPFKFAKSQVKRAIEKQEKYFVCTLERPQEGMSATIEYIKDHIKFIENPNEFMIKVERDINDFERIDSNNGDVKLVIDQRDKPRVHVDYKLMLATAKDFKDLIAAVKQALL